MNQWETYGKVEPWGDECLYLALLCTWFFNANYAGDGEQITPQQVIDHVEALKHRYEPLPVQQDTQSLERLRSWAMSQITPK